MNWQSVDDRHRKKYERSFVICEEPGERDYLIRLILDAHPYYMRDEVEKAVSACCRSVPAPRSRAQFILCLKTRLQAGG